VTRFRKWPRPAAYVETSCKGAAFVAKQPRDRVALPLFAGIGTMCQRLRGWLEGGHRP
jgi:hypothetical protein